MSQSTIQVTDYAFSNHSSSTDFNYEGADLEAMAEAKNYPRWILEEFSQHLSGDVAEVGAGSGNFAKFILESGVDSITLFEPSCSMFSKLSTVFAGNDRIKTESEFLQKAVDRYERSFDAVIYNNVMEHVEDDCAELKAVFKVLKPGGCVLIFVPALSWLYSSFDKSLGHYRRYNKQQGVKLLFDTGFHIERVKYADMLGVLPWLVCMKLLGRSISNNSVKLYDRVGVPVSRRIDKLFGAPLGKNLILIGRKPHNN